MVQRPATFGTFSMLSDYPLSLRPLSESSAAPIMWEWRSSKWFILVTICLSVFSDAFLYGVVVPVLPFSLSERSGILEDKVQFWTSVLLASFGAAQLLGSPFFGWLADRSSSRRTPFLLGLCINALATAIFGLAKSVYVLALSRFLQGLSAAIVWTVGLALLVDTMGQEDVGQWMGYVLTSVNAGILVAPLAGGLLYDSLGYLSLFVVMVGLITVDISLRLIMMERKSTIKLSDPGAYSHFSESHRRNPKRRYKKPNLACLLIEHAEKSSRPDTESLEPLDNLKGQSFLIHSVAHTPPLITLLKSPRILAALYGKWVEATIVIGFDSALPIFVNQTFGWDSRGAGFIFLTTALPSLSAPFVGMLSDRYGARWVSAIGFIICTPATTLLLLVTGKTVTQIVLFCALLTIDGFAFVMMISPLAADLTAAVITMEKENPGIFGNSGAYAQVYALFTCAIGAGVLAGPAWVSFAYDRAGWTFMVCTLGALSASAIAPVVLFTGMKEPQLCLDPESVNLRNMTNFESNNPVGSDDFDDAASGLEPY